MYILLFHQTPQTDLATNTAQFLEAHGYPVWVCHPHIDWTSASNTSLLNVVSQTCAAVVLVAPDETRPNAALEHILHNASQHEKQIFTVLSSADIADVTQQLTALIPIQKEQNTVPAMQIDEPRRKKNSNQQNGLPRRVLLLIAVVIMGSGLYWLSPSLLGMFQPVVPTLTPSPTLTSTATETATLTATVTASPTVTATATETTTATATLTSTVTASPTTTATSTPSATASATATMTTTVTLTNTVTVSPTVTATSTPTATVTATRSNPVLFVTNTPYNIEMPTSQP